MAAGWTDYLRKLLGWWSAKELALVAGPYRVAVSDTFSTGAAAADTFSTGSAAADTFCTGAIASEGIPHG